MGNTIIGNAGVNVINGGGGADMLYGGAGGDTYYVDLAADKVFEALNQGTDAVYASVSFALGAGQHIEALGTTSQTGTGAINLTGNELAQTIYGNNSVNVINGGGGNDLIYGRAGNDRLTGGAGNDSFIFNTALNKTTNVDTITDFNPVYDTIRLDNAVMAALGTKFESAEFWKSSSGLAHDSNDRIIYETDTGWLNFDSNGSAVGGGAIHIAKLAPNLALTASDFFVV